MTLRGQRRDVPAGEGGFVMVIVIFTLLIALLIGAAGLAETLDSRAVSLHSARERRAQQAADAGIQSELYQQSENQIGNAGSSFDLSGELINATHLLDCIEPTVNGSAQITGLVQASVSAGGSTACPNPTPTGFAKPCDLVALGNHAFACTEYFPGATNPISGASEIDLNPKIVSLGWDGSSNPAASGNVFSREEAILAPIKPMPVLAANDSATINGVTLTGGVQSAVLSAFGISNLATSIAGDVQIDDNLTVPSVDTGLDPTLSNGLLGVIQYGGTLSPSNAIVAAQLLNSTPPYRQPVTISASKSSCPSSNPTCAGISGYSASTDSVSSSGNVTLSGGDYVFCNFSAGGTVIANGTAATPVRIFIDSPYSSRCAADRTSESTNATFNHSEWNEGNFTALGGVDNTDVVSSAVVPSAMQLYVAGDQASPAYDDTTYVEIGTPGTGTDGGLKSTNQPTVGMLAYAPTSEVSLTTANCKSVPLVGTICLPGAFAGNLIGDDVSATALTFTQDLNLANDPLYNGVNAFQVEQEVQCTPLPTDGSGNTYTSLQQTLSTDTDGC